MLSTGYLIAPGHGENFPRSRDPGQILKEAGRGIAVAIKVKPKNTKTQSQ